MPRPIAISKNRTIKYVSSLQKDDPEHEIIYWNLRVLPGLVRDEATDRLYVEATSDETVTRTEVSRVRGRRQACKFGLMDWYGAPFEDETGASIRPEFERVKRHGVYPLTDACLDLFPSDLLMELGYEIIKLSTTVGAEMGKSELPPTPSQETSESSAQHA